MVRTVATALAIAGAATAITVVAGCGSTAQVPIGADLTGSRMIQSSSAFVTGMSVATAGTPLGWDASQRVVLVIDMAEGQGVVAYKRYTPEGGQPQRESVNGAIVADGDIPITDSDGMFEGVWRTV